MQTLGSGRWMELGIGGHSNGTVETRSKNMPVTEMLILSICSLSLNGELLYPQCDMQSPFNRS